MPEDDTIPRLKDSMPVIYNEGPVVDDCHAIFNLTHRAAEDIRRVASSLSPDSAADCLRWLREAARISEETLEPELIAAIDRKPPQPGLDTSLDSDPQDVED